MAKMSKLSLQMVTQAPPYIRYGRLGLCDGGDSLVHCVLSFGGVGAQTGPLLGLERSIETSAL